MFLYTNTDHSVNLLPLLRRFLHNIPSVVPWNMSEPLMLLWNPLFTALLCCIIPLFIINIRELYDQDLCRRQQGIDTGFGILSQSHENQNAAISAIAFADVIPEEVHAIQGHRGDSETTRPGAIGEDGERQV